MFRAISLVGKIFGSFITRIFQNLPVSAILVLPVFSRIFQYLQYWYNQYFLESSGICNYGNDQYLLVLQILENSGRYWNTSIYQYLYQYCRYWKILEKTGNTSIVYNTGNTSIVAGCFIISRFRSYELKRVIVRVMVFSATFNNISVILWHSVLMAVLTKANPDIFQLQVIAICKKSKD